MRRHYFQLALTLVFLAAPGAFAQMNTWTPKAAFEGGPRIYAAGFSIGDKLYVGTGYNDNTDPTNDLWEYDPVNNSWDNKANVPGGVRLAAVGFAINGKGYIILGTDNFGPATNQVWEYDPLEDEWTQKADYEGPVVGGAIAFVINGRAYVGMGQGVAAEKSNELWEFDPVADEWTSKAAFPGTRRSLAVAFSSATTGYVVTGADDDETALGDFWQYTPGNNTWTQKQDFPGVPRSTAIAFTVGGSAFVGAGYDNEGEPLKDLWEYNLTTGIWLPRANLPVTNGVVGGVGLSTATKGYLTGGLNPLYTDEHFEYTPAVLTAQTITFGALPAKTFGDADFDLTATASSSLTVSYSSSDPLIASISGSTVAIHGAGEVTITANQAGDGTYDVAPAVQQTLTINKATQTVSFSALPGKTFGDPTFNLTATATSTLAVSFQSSDANVATISGNTVTIVGAGSTTITATQAGNDNYLPDDETQSLTVAKASQTITFGALANKQMGDADFALTATASSTLTVSYESSNTAVVTISGNTVTIVGGGTTTITAKQAGNNSYLPAADVPQSLTVTKASQTITFGPLANKQAGDADFTLTATASSTLPVSFESSNTAVATVAGNTVTIVSSGTTTITARQGGNAFYLPAPDVPQSLTVNKGTQTITLADLTAAAAGSTPIVLPEKASSDLTISYTSSDPAVASVSGNILTPLAKGVTLITATQAGDANFDAATPVTKTFRVLGEFVPGPGQGLLVGLAGGGSNGLGTIFKMNANGENYATAKNFLAESDGTRPGNNGMIVYNGRMWGMLMGGGASNNGIIYEYDISTSTYTVRHEFDGINGRSPVGDLIEVYGKLYGVFRDAKINSTYSAGGLFEFDPVTYTFTIKATMSVAGYYPTSGLVVLNGKLYGTTRDGGSANGGSIFEYVPGGTTVVTKASFTDATGKNPGALAVKFNSIYGCTQNGGIYGYGTLFEYNQLTSVLTKRHDFQYYNIYGTPPLTPSGNGRLYGRTIGPNNDGVIFEFNPDTYAYVTRFTFDYTNADIGSMNYGGMAIGPDWKLYGTTNGSFNNGVFTLGSVFSFDPATSVYEKIHTMSAEEGSPYQAGTVGVAGNGKIYGLTSTGGAYNAGTLYEVDPVSKELTTKHNFKFAPNGYHFSRPLMPSKNGKLYSIALGGVNGGNVIFEFDPKTKAYVKKVDLLANQSKFFLQSGMIEAPSGKIYGMGSPTGGSDPGILVEYDKDNEAFEVKYTFNDLGVGTGPSGGLSYLNGKLYGRTNFGGSGFGTVFEFDLQSGTCVSRASLSVPTGIGPNRDPMVLAPNGKFYGIMNNGGANSLGTIIEFDPVTYTLTKKADFSTATGGSVNGLTLAPNGKFYGATGTGGAGNKGTLFEFDPATATLVKKLDLTDEVGYTLSYAFVESSNGKLYGAAIYGGGSGGNGTIVEYDPATNVLTKKKKFDTYTDSEYGPSTLTFVEVDVSVQSITFDAIPDKVFTDAPFTPVAAATSGLPVSFTSSNANVAVIENGKIVIKGVGVTDITASQEGNENFENAPPVTRELKVNKADKPITIDAIPDKAIGAAAFMVTVNGAEGRTVALSTTTPTKIVVNLLSVTVQGAGRATIKAAAQANTHYNAYEFAEASFCIKPAKPVITHTGSGGEILTLISNSTTGNQWYLNGTVITGATTRTYLPTVQGIYTVKVTVDDCVSDASDPMPTLVTGLEGRLTATPMLYPNPARERVTVLIPGNKGSTLTMLDARGLAKESLTSSEEAIELDVQGYPAGVYLVRISNDKGALQTLKMIKQ